MIAQRVMGCRFLLAALAMLLSCGVSAAGSIEPPRPGIAIENVTVIDADAGARAGQRVVVDGERIVSVAPMTASAPDTAKDAITTVDASGRFLIPGLWDMHVHFLYDLELTAAMPRLFLEHGVTSVRDTGGDLAELVAFRARLESLVEPSPRVLLAGPLLDGRRVVYDGSDPGRPRLGTRVPDPAAARTIVAELAAAGADFIKVYELVDPAVFDALVESADELGLPVASHVPLSMTADVAGPRVDSMEHLRNIELACAADWRSLLDTRLAYIESFQGTGYELRSALHSLQRYAAIEAFDEARCDDVLASLHETLQVPTLRLNASRMAKPYDRAGWDSAVAGLPTLVRDRWSNQVTAARAANVPVDRRFADWSLGLVARMKQHGVPLGAGTDTPIGLAIPGYSLHTELEFLVRAGLTPLEALHSATIAPAGFFGRADEGLIAPGMRADLVLLDANPLEDITHTRDIARVMVGGRWVAR